MNTSRVIRIISVLVLAASFGATHAVVIKSEQGLCQLIQDNKGVCYDATSKTLSLRLNRSAEMVLRAAMGLEGAVFAAIGISFLRDASRDRSPMCGAFGACLLAAAYGCGRIAIDDFKKDFHITLSPQGVRHADKFVAWSAVSDVSYLASVRLQNFIKTDDLEKKETLLDITSLGLPVVFDEFVAIVKYYHATYGSLVSKNVPLKTNIEHELIKHFHISGLVKNKLDSFFEENNLAGSLDKVRSFFKSDARAKIVGKGTRCGVYELSILDNQYLLKIPHDVQAGEKTSDPVTWFPSCIKRQNISRVLKAHCLQNIIYDNDMKGLKVPKKYLYHIPGTPLELTDENYLVVVEKINCAPHGESYSRASKEQISHLLHLTANAHFLDTADGNIEMDQDGNLVLLDTEDIWSFMQDDGLLSDQELKELAAWCARGLLSIESLKPVVRGIKDLPLEDILNYSCKDPASLKKVIMLERSVRSIGAAIVDLNLYDDILSPADKKEIGLSLVIDWLFLIEQLYLFDSGSKDILEDVLIKGLFDELNYRED
jgi:hypothetical protein